MKIAQILFVFTNMTYTLQGPLPPAPSPPVPPGLPVDDYVFFLFILAVIYGVKKSYDLAKPKA